MNTRQRIQKKVPSQSTYTPVQNLYQTRSFGIQPKPSQSSSQQGNVDLDEHYKQSQYLGHNLLNIPVNAPGTEPPPPIQTKLTIGQPGDKYEQEADQVASQVVQQINSPTSDQSAQGQTVQRQEEEEPLQTKSISNNIQRQEEEEPLQTKSISNNIQRQEEEEPLQTKSISNNIQRQEEEEPLQTKSISNNIQRQEEEEPLQTKSISNNIQRQEEEEPLQTKSISNNIQRQEEEEPLQTKSISNNIQRQEEEEPLQTKSISNNIQRQEEEEPLQTKSISNNIQRQEEEEPLQTKSISNNIQRQEEEEPLQGKSVRGGMAATPNLETTIQGARGSGQPLDENIRQPMEKAFGGVDFSQVKVHNDAQSDQLNQSIQARAFTTGQDLFFRGGEYNPSSRGGQELIAHELTHVVQQGGASQIQRQLTDDLTPGQIEKMEEKGGALIQPKFHSISQTQTSTIQRAYTARRPLAGFIRGMGRMSRGGVIPNRGIFHEHIFFQDGGNPANIGFMGSNGLGQDNGGNYTIGHGRNNLDDPIMRQAVNDLGNPGQYSLLGNNCQRYVSNVYARYLELGGRAGT